MEAKYLTFKADLCKFFRFSVHFSEKIFWLKIEISNVKFTPNDISKAKSYSRLPVSYLPFLNRFSANFRPIFGQFSANFRPSIGQDANFNVQFTCNDSSKAKSCSRLTASLASRSSSSRTSTANWAVYCSCAANSLDISSSKVTFPWSIWIEQKKSGLFLSYSQDRKIIYINQFIRIIQVIHHILKGIIILRPGLYFEGT